MTDLPVGKMTVEVRIAETISWPSLESIVREWCEKSYGLLLSSISIEPGKDTSKMWDLQTSKISLIEPSTFTIRPFKPK